MQTILAEELLELLTDSRKNADDIMGLAKANEIDSTFNFSELNVRSIMLCDVCNGPRCIFSMKAIGGPNDSSERQA